MTPSIDAYRQVRTATLRLVYDLHDADAVDATRALRSTLHGFVILETGGGFGLPVGTDRSYQRLVQALVTSFETWIAQK